jgi:hypothetical protein
MTVEDCSLCPAGKYANTTGNTSESNCLDCPAGRTSSNPGSRYCECITAESCDMPVQIGSEIIDFYKNGIDYFRETVPYIGG